MSTSHSDQGPGVRKPLVVIVDDEDQEGFSELIVDHGVEAVSVAPDDLDSGLLARATAVVLDQYLDTWPQRDGVDLPLALRVPDGLSLAAVLRSHVEGSASRDGPNRVPVAFALRTGELDRLGAGVPRAAREYLLARQYNLEWVFSKSQDTLAQLPSPAGRIASLARAAGMLPTRWDADSGNPGHQWLALQSGTWSDDAKWQIEQCRPPQHVVAERTAGLAWLRWFLHRILPFPTFLFDHIYLSTALGISLSSLEEVLSSNSQLALRLGELQYRGALNDFLGRRWWRAGVSHLSEELLDMGQQLGYERVHAIANGAIRLHGSQLDVVNVDDPVVGIDANYTTIRDPLSASSAVRLQPDDWPPYADDAWAARAELQAEDADPELVAMVVSTDRWRLRGEQGEREDTSVKMIPPQKGAPD